MSGKLNDSGGTLFLIKREKLSCEILCTSELNGFDGSASFVYREMIHTFMFRRRSIEVSYFRLLNMSFNFDCLDFCVFSGACETSPSSVTVRLGVR